MSSEWLKITPSLETGLKIIEDNCRDNGKFRALVNHICSALQLGDDGKKMLSREERDKLLASLEIDEATLIVLLDTIEFIYLQAAYTVVKPAIMMETLVRKSFSISEDKVSILTNAWIAHAKGIVESRRNKSIFPAQVNDLSWQLNVQSSSSALSREARPLVLLQLGLTGDEKKSSKLCIQMDKNDLTDIYKKLENIQRQLDQLEWAPEKN